MGAAPSIAVRLALGAAAGVLAFTASPQAAQARTGAPAVDRLGAFRERLVAEVDSGLAAAAKRWGWQGWYRDKPGQQGYSSIWETVQLFEAYVGLAAASPTPSHLRLLSSFALASEGYANPALGGGVGGFSTGYRTRGDVKPNWYDDNGWLGLAFVDTYRATRRVRFLRDAQRAFRYLVEAGWDDAAGGIWWNTDRTYKCAESVNTAALLATLLYQATGDPADLRWARRLVDWADAHLFDATRGLYVNHPRDGVPISYLESPLLDAKVRLCRRSGLYCGGVGPLTEATLARYGGAVKSSPQFDAMYIRYLLDAYAANGDARLYAVASANAARIEANAADSEGLYLRDWDGGGFGVTPGLVAVHGAALETLAWTAAATPPDGDAVAAPPGDLEGAAPAAAQPSRG